MKTNTSEPYDLNLKIPSVGKRIIIPYGDIFKGQTGRIISVCKKSITVKYGPEKKIGIYLRDKEHLWLIYDR